MLYIYMFNCFIFTKFNGIKYCCKMTYVKNCLTNTKNDDMKYTPYFSYI